MKEKYSSIFREVCKQVAYMAEIAAERAAGDVGALERGTVLAAGGDGERHEDRRGEAGDRPQHRPGPQADDERVRET